MGRPLTARLRRLEEPATLALAGVALALAALLPLLFLIGGVLRAPQEMSAGLAVLRSAEPWRLLLRSVSSALCVAALCIAIGVPLGLVLGRTDVRGRWAALLLHAFPAFLPPFLLVLGWFQLFARGGLWGTAASSSALFSGAGAIVLQALAFVPVVTALVFLGLQSMDPSLEEAGRVVAGPWRMTTRILLPMVWPAAALGGFVVFALALSDLGVPMFLRVRAYPAAVFARLGGAQYAPGEALILALPMLGVSLALLALERVLVGPRSFALLGARATEREVLPLGPWRAPISLAAWLVVAATLLPFLGLCWRAARGGGFAAASAWIGDGIQNSLVPAALAATVLVPIALVLGRAVALRRPAAAALDALAVLAFVTPAAILGVGLMGVWNRPATQSIYGTFAIIVLGFVARYAVLPVRALAVAIAQAPRHLEEAAAVHGGRFLFRLARIVLPLHWRGATAAWLLAFVFCLRDLETAVLFYPPGSAPLTVRILTLEANGPEAVVAALALIHAALVAGALAVGGVVLRGRRAA